MTAKELAKSLPNVGIKLAEKLINANIDSPQKLAEIGAESAFIKINETKGFCGKFNALYLYALEGAITNCNWLKIPEARKIEFKKFTKQLRKDK
ncbi:MAG: competence protein TfoX [Bacteroidetes bacterium]|nr:competence protein TfoX [Bacteroidota bacterium]